MGKASDSEECVIEDTKILSDKKWIASLDKEELAWLEENIISFEELEDKKVVCSSCFEQGNHKRRGYYVRHPALGVPICKRCKDYYFEGSWRKDSDGKFEYCGWCAQGGDLLCCAEDKCPNSFCTKCIKRNLGRQVVSKIEECDTWKCFECNLKQLSKLRLLYYSIYKFWLKTDEDLAKAKAKVERKNRTDCITKTYHLAVQANRLSRNFVTKSSASWQKNPGFEQEKEKIHAAEEIAKFIAFSQKNLDQLKTRFFEFIDEDLGVSKKRNETLKKIAEDVGAISNGHLEEIVAKKEKVKYEVLNDSSDEGKSTNVNGNGAIEVILSDDEDEDKSLKSSSEDESFNDVGEEEEASPVKRAPRKAKSKTPLAKKSSSKKGGVKIRIGTKNKVKVESGSDLSDFEESKVTSTPRKKSSKSEDEKEPQESAKKQGGKTSKDNGDVADKPDQDDSSKLKDSKKRKEEELPKKEEKSEKKPSPCKSKKEETSVAAREAVLASSSDDEDSPKKEKAKAENSVKKASPKKVKKEEDSAAKQSVLDTSEESEAILDDSVQVLNDSPDLLSSEDEQEKLGKQLRSRFNELIEKIDVKKDAKIKGSPIVTLTRLSDRQEAKLKESGKNVLKLGKTEIKAEIKSEEGATNETEAIEEAETKVEKSAKASESISRDKEIDRLCQIGALEKLVKRKRGGAQKPKGKTMRNGKKKADSEVEELSSDDMEISQTPTKHKKPMPKSKSLAKEAVLASSDSDLSDCDGAKQNGKKNTNKVSKENGSKDRKKKSRNDPDFMRVKLDETDSEEEAVKAKKGKARRKIVDESDEDEIQEVKKGKKKNGKKSAKGDVSSGDDFQEGSEAEESEDKSDEEHNSEEEEEDSDIGAKKKVAKSKKRKKKSTSSSGDTSDDEPRPKKKRRRIKKNKDSSDEEAASDDDENASPSKGGRKDIRKIIKDKKLSKTTKTAAENERERRKRVEEKQALFNELVEIKDNVAVTEVPLDIDSESKEVLVRVHPDLAKKLKPHQARGIRFMWQSVFETKKDVEKNKVPGGAILAHCMGLGKTLQTIGLIHTVMTNFPEDIKHTLVLAPVNTLKNWEDEFYKWLDGDMEDDIEVYEISGEKDMWGRTDRLRYWRKNGGVLIMGYDNYRNLTNEKSKKFKKKQKEVFHECLVDPGPNLVVCDEGHILKNTKSALNIALNRIKTRRRIILTGTPLQNNLSEYFAMVDFVKPSLLGTYNEFRNRFVNPISNGQASDSTERDVRIMKKRSFILNDLLKGCLQRLDYNVLVPFLQPKHEYVLCICLTDFQKKLYSYYLENYARAGQIGLEGKLEGGKKGGLFYDVQNLSRVWNHPFILLKAKEKADIARVLQEDAEEDEQFINDDDEESEAKSTGSDNSEESGSDVEEVKRRKITTRGGRGDSDKLVAGLDEVKAETLASDKGWWSRFMQDPEDDHELMNLELGSKMVLLMDILKECYLIGDKVLVFSQSLMSLDLIEKFLQLADSGDLEEMFGTWKHGKDYFRMDGSTAPDVRKKWCSYFNNKKNTDMRLFLISTKAGGLGINLVAANRVIIFDASWNPAHDVQSIFRVYRFGQEKPVYIYRFLAKGTMEEKIYDRQVTKQSLSARVVDEQQIERHFTMNELAELYTFNDEPKENQPTFKLPQDKLLAELITKHKDLIWKIHDHDSLLENQVDEQLTEEERKAAWKEFEDEKEGIRNIASTSNLNMGVVMSQINPEMIRNQYRQQYPHLTEDQINQATRAYMIQIQSGFTGKIGYDRSHYAQEMARARQHQQQMYPGVYASARGARPVDQVTDNDLVGQARKLQMLQQQMAKYREAQQAQAAAQLSSQLAAYQQLQQRQLQQRTNMARVTMKAPSGASGVTVTKVGKKPARKPETITLDDMDDDDISEVTPNDDGEGEEIMLDGAPEVEDYDEFQPSTSRRRGRPRLDPDTDL